MKTTVEIDHEKLKKVMELTGIKTQRQAIDYALEQASRFAKIMNVFNGDFYTNDYSDVIDPKYNLNRIRKKELKKA